VALRGIVGSRVPRVTLACKAQKVTKEMSVFVDQLVQMDSQGLQVLKGNLDSVAQLELLGVEEPRANKAPLARWVHAGPRATRELEVCVVHKVCVVRQVTLVLVGPEETRASKVLEAKPGRRACVASLVSLASRDHEVFRGCEVLVVFLARGV